MANKANGPSIDYYELRRRHDEYKKTQEEARRRDEAQAEPAAPAAPEAANAPVNAVNEVPSENTVPAAQTAQDIPVHNVPAQDVPAQDVPADPVKEASAPVSAESDGADVDGDFDGGNPGGNPFAFAMKAYIKLKDRIASRRAEDNLPLDDSDDGYDDELIDEPAEEKGGHFRFLRRHRDVETFEEDESGAEGESTDGADYHDAPESYADSGAFPPMDAEPAATKTPNDAAPVFDAEDIPDEQPQTKAPAFTFEDDSVGDGAAESGQYEDDYEDEDDTPRSSALKKFISLFIVREDGADVYDEDDIDIEDVESAAEPVKGFDDSIFIKPRNYPDNEEVVLAMDEQEKKARDMSELMAEGIDENTMSRRERREMRERQAAAAKTIDGADDASTIPDEPTREYTIVSRPGARTDEVSFFDDSDAPSSAAKSTADEYDEDEDEYEEEKPARKSWFGRSKSKDDDYDDDFDEDDDDYDDDYDDDDEPVKKKRKARSRRDDYDDDDYDDYDDDYDDDDDSPSAGHYVLGVIKVIIAIVLIAVIAVFGLYFADQALDGGVPAYDWLREKVPFLDSVLPVEDEPAIAPEITAEPTVEPAEDAAPTAEPAPAEPTAEPAQAESTEEPAEVPAG